MSNPKSLEHIEKRWHPELAKYCSESTKLLLVSNKSDLGRHAGAVPVRDGKVRDRDCRASCSLPHSRSHTRTRIRTRTRAYLTARGLAPAFLHPSRTHSEHVASCEFTTRCSCRLVLCARLSRELLRLCASRPTTRESSVKKRVALAVAVSERALRHEHPVLCRCSVLLFCLSHDSDFATAYTSRKCCSVFPSLLMINTSTRKT